MSKIQLIIQGRIPSKKNSVLAFYRNGRIIHIPSNQYRKWHQQACRQIKQYGVPTIAKPSSIIITLWAGDRRKGDLTNKAESVMDLLVDCGILPDDNWYICGDIRLKFGGVDAQNPRTEITIIT